MQHDLGQAERSNCPHSASDPPRWLGVQAYPPRSGPRAPGYPPGQGPAPLRRELALWVVPSTGRSTADPSPAAGTLFEWPPCARDSRCMTVADPVLITDDDALLGDVLRLAAAAGVAV